MTARSINFKGQSAISIQLSTEDLYRNFPSRAVAADVHGILLRVASLEDTLRGKIRAEWKTIAGMKKSTPEAVVQGTFFRFGPAA